MNYETISSKVDNGKYDSKFPYPSFEDVRSGKISKEKDREMKEIVLSMPKEELMFNYSRIWHILKDMLGDFWISEDSMNYLRSYSEKWLEYRILKAVDKMKEKDSWRKTLKVRDFKFNIREITGEPVHLHGSKKN